LVQNTHLIEELQMHGLLLRTVYVFAILAAMSSSTAFTEDCSGTITPEEALRGEDARYAAQTSRDFSALQQLIGDDLVYIHSSANVDAKAAYIESQRAGTV